MDIMAKKASFSAVIWSSEVVSRFAAPGRGGGGSLIMYSILSTSSGFVRSISQA